MPDLYLGIDIGTSGARAIAINDDGIVQAEAKTPMVAFGDSIRDPAIWWAAVKDAVRTALAQTDAASVRALSIDGTSGTMVATDPGGNPLRDGLMYNDACPDPDLVAQINAAAPADSAARGANSALARAIQLAPDAAMVLHQADWISGQFSGRWVSDENNALKTGYDLARRAWPDWIARAGLDIDLLPDVLQPGDVIGGVTREAAQAFGLAQGTRVVAGTTDGCASFVATGANRPGDAVTALGTTMTIKMLSERPISAPEFGIYSHRILGQWLAGGASNTGGNVLLKFFDPDRIAALSTQIDPDTECALDYYPLAKPGERFPIADPELAPRLEPRPEDDAAFLKGLFDGIARIEALAYRRLQELGAPALASVRTVGGGAANPIWTRLRAHRFNVPMPAAASAEAAYGTALLARRGAA